MKRFLTSTIGIAALTILASGCKRQEPASDKARTVEASRPKTDPAVEKLARESNGNWREAGDKTSFMHAYISAGIIAINQIEIDKPIGNIAGRYKPDMRPGSTEPITIEDSSGTLAKASSISITADESNRLTLTIDGKTYPLKKMKETTIGQPAETMAEKQETS